MASGTGMSKLQPQTDQKGHTQPEVPANITNSLCWRSMEQRRP